MGESAENDFQPWSKQTNAKKYFFLQTKKTSHPPLNFNSHFVKQVQFQKHLGVYLDGKLDFREHIQNMFKKINETISLLRKLQNNLSRAPFVTIRKLFIWQHLDYRDVLH